MNIVRQSSEVSRTLFDILAYLIDHPEADDTIEGIAQWWLLEQRIRRQISVIEKALAELVDKGFVLEQSSSNGRTRYRVNRHMENQIKTFLNRRQKHPDCDSNSEHPEL